MDLKICLDMGETLITGRLAAVYGRYRATVRL